LNGLIEHTVTAGKGILDEETYFRLDELGYCK
jgi:hypothetical protein